MHRLLASLGTRARRLVHGHAVSVWYDPSYRLPFASIEASTGIDPRRADMALSHVISRGALLPDDVRTPSRVRYEDLGRVHSQSWLESLQDPAVVARVFAVDPSDVVLGEALHTVRLACGGTLDAAREALQTRGPTMNLLGGFHHAGPSSGGGFCLVNDIAVAVQAVRTEGFRKRVVVIDLDAHPPDGTAECFRDDPSVFIGSISGAEWGPLPGVDETILERGAGDAEYLAAVAALLARMPDAGLAFVLAGGDVLAGDRLGALGLSLDGVRRRDLMVHRRLHGIPSVWLPGGGYTADAWRALAGTLMVLARESLEPIAPDADPLGEQFSSIARALIREKLEGPFVITEADLLGDLTPHGRRERRFMGYYTAEGIEYALSRYGLLSHLRRLGYGSFRVEIDRDERGDRFRLFAEADGQEHLLYEVVLERQPLGDDTVLYVHWLTLRNPRGRFSDERPRLPGQEEPGLGLAKEAGQLMARTAERLGLAGVAFRPAWYHTAYAARFSMSFVDAAQQGRFQAMLRDFADTPLLEVTHAMTEGRVRINGEPYKWEAGEMVYWLDHRPRDHAAADAEMNRVRFEIVSG
jgi:acetoin utilization deacetylase AcuC-like enzyme